MDPNEMDRALLERLVPDNDDPWERSGEGIDDDCHYCGEWRHDWTISDTDRRSRYYHEPDCVWMEAVAYLGRTTEDVHVSNVEYDAIQAAKPPRKPGPFDAILDGYKQAVGEYMKRSTPSFFLSAFAGEA